MKKKNKNASIRNKTDQIDAFWRMNDEWLEIYNVEMKLLEFSVCNAEANS